MSSNFVAGIDVKRRNAKVGLRSRERRNLVATVAERAEAVSHCWALVAGYHRDIDSGHATAGIVAFHDDAEFEAHGRTFRGRVEILGFLQARESDIARQTVHVLANKVVTDQDGDGQDNEVGLRAMALVHVRRPDGTYRLERVLDTVHQFRYCDGRWRITRRTSSPLHPAA